MEVSNIEEHEMSIADYVVIAQRRVRPMLMVLLTVLLLSQIVLAFWPATYRSTATILIEEQEVPQDLVRSTVTSYAARQIQVISKRVMTSANLAALVKRLELYEPEVRNHWSDTGLAGRFREGVELEMVSAKVVNPNGRATEATIAFQLSFEDEDPEVAKRVADELVTLYLDENTRSRDSISAGTAEFLRAEAKVLDSELRDIEEQIAQFERENEGALPKSYALNINNSDRAEQQLLNTRLKIQQLQQRKLELDSNLSLISPTAPITMATGEVTLSEGDRLKALQSEFRRKVSLYKNNHPDIIRLKREIESLVASGAVEAGRSELLNELAKERRELTRMRSLYSNSSQTLAQERLVTDLENELVTTAYGSSIVVPDNPAYVLLSTQIQGVQGEISSLRRQEQDLNNRVNELSQLLSRAPSVEKEYAALKRDHQAANEKYREIKSKQLGAGLAQSLEQGNKSDRFTLIEPPIVPFAPVSPNKSVMTLLGLLLSIAAAALTAVICEALDKSIRGEKRLAEELGFAPFEVIPYIENDADRASFLSSGSNKFTIFLGGLVLLVWSLFVYKPAAGANIYNMLLRTFFGG